MVFGCLLGSPCIFLAQADGVCECKEPLPVITFGQTADLSGTDKYTGFFYRSGILAAFNEYNQNVLPDQKFILKLKTLDDTDSVDKATQNMLALAQDDAIFGIIGIAGAARTQAAVPIAVDHNKPILSAYGSLSIRNPFQRHVVNLRASYYDESAAVVEYLVSIERTRIAVFMQNDTYGATVLQGVVAALSSSNLYLHSTTYCTEGANSTILTNEVGLALQMMMMAKKPPTAIVLATTFDAAVIMTFAARQAWPDIYLAILSPVSSSVALNKALAVNSPVYYHFVTAQIVPVPSNVRLPVVKRYLAALNIQALNASFSSLEGYLLGRLAIAALERVRGFNYTAEKFLDAIYETSYFNFDGLRVGPFVLTNSSSGCNQGMHDVYVLSIMENRTMTLEDSLSFPSTCGYKQKEWNQITFGMACSFAEGTSQAMNCESFYQGVLAAFKQVNDDGGIRGTTKLYVNKQDDQGHAQLALTWAQAFLGDPSIFGLIGFGSPAIDAIADLVTTSNKVLFGAFTGDDSIRVPFRRSVLNFRASVADEMFAIMHFCYYNKHLTKLALLYEDTTWGNETRNDFFAALNEKRLAIYAEASYSGSSSIGEALQHIITSGSDLQALVFAGTDQALETVAQIVHAHNDKAVIFGISTTDAARLTQNRLLSKNSTGDTSQGSIVNWENVVITQTVPSVENTSIAVVAAYINAMTTLDDSLVLTSSGLEGFIVGQMVAVSLNRILGKDLTVENMLNAVYENGNFNLDGLRCGPFDDGSASSGEKNCSQCMKTVFLVGFQDDGTALNALDSFAFGETCMYEPTENLDFKLGTRLVLVILACCGIGYTTIVMVLIVVFRNNQHVRATSYRFSLLSCLGGVVCYCGVFAIYPIPTRLTCALQPWLVDIAFVLLFGPIFAKTYRIDKLFNTKRLKRRVISDRHVAQICVLLVLVFVGFLVTWMVLDMPFMQEAFTPGENLRYESCTNKYSTFGLVDVILKGFVLVWGCFLCQRVFKIKGQFAKFNESKEMVVCIFHTSFVAGCTLVMGYATKANPNLQFLSISALVVENTGFVVTLLYTRVVYFAMIGKVHVEDKDDRETTSDEKTSTGTVMPALTTSTNASCLTGTEPTRSGNTRSGPICGKVLPASPTSAATPLRTRSPAKEADDRNAKYVSQH